MKYTLNIIAASLLLSLSGCFYWPFKSDTTECCPMGESEYELLNAQPVEFKEVDEETAETAPDVKAKPDVKKIPAKTLSEMKLEDIIKEQDVLLHKLNNAETSVISVNDEKKLADIANRYENYLLSNTQDVYAYILYGKFLRKVDHVDRAVEIFYKADDLNPNVPVIKQQIGNCLAELGEYALALPFFLEAIDLDPKIAQYHYQLGEFIGHYKANFVADGAFTADALDEQMLAAFQKATQLDSAHWGYKMRYAESYYDLTSPKWNDALQLWNNIEAVAPDELSKEMIYLNKARILISLNKLADAKTALSTVENPLLQKNKADLMSAIDRATVQPVASDTVALPAEFVQPSEPASEAENLRAAATTTPSEPAVPVNP